MITSTHPVTNYRADLFPLLALSEGFGQPSNRPGLPYFDSVGKATIGYGFNIEDRNVARLVLAQMGILAGKTDSQVLQIESDLRAAINAGEEKGVRNHCLH
jgi:GH24 family phage-related lysozyme (muramidase)